MSVFVHISVNQRSIKLHCSSNTV